MLSHPNFLSSWRHHLKHAWYYHWTRRGVAMTLCSIHFCLLTSAAIFCTWVQVWLFFPVVCPRTLNDLPDDVTSAESLSSFRQRLETHLFTKYVGLETVNCMCACDDCYEDDDNVNVLFQASIKSLRCDEHWTQCVVCKVLCFFIDAFALSFVAVLDVLNWTACALRHDFVYVYVRGYVARMLL